MGANVRFGSFASVRDVRNMSGQRVIRTCRFVLDCSDQNDPWLPLASQSVQNLVPPLVEF